MDPVPVELIPASPADDDDFDPIRESSRRTSRFFYKYRTSGVPEEFDPERSIRITTRHINWEGEPIDHQAGAAHESEFDIIGLLGGGGMGTVYTARQNRSTARSPSK